MRTKIEPSPTIGHSCQGGGATITNSPIILHIHIHAANEPLLLKIKRSLYALLGQRHITVERVAELSSDDIQGVLLRKLEDR